MKIVYSRALVVELGLEAAKLQHTIKIADVQDDQNEVPTLEQR